MKHVYLIAYTLRGEDRDYEPIQRVIKSLAESGDSVHIDGSLWAVRTYRHSRDITDNLIKVLSPHGGDLLFVTPLLPSTDWSLIGASGEDGTARTVLETWLWPSR